MGAADQHGLMIGDPAAGGEQAESLVKAHRRHLGVLLLGGPGGRHGGELQSLDRVAENYRRAETGRPFYLLGRLAPILFT
jgi:hypothetical protein